MRNKFKFLLVINFIAILFFSCASSSGEKFAGVMTSVIGTGNLKYYIRPSKMLSENYSEDKAYLMIDFSYQMKNADYVSDAYTNFSIYFDKISYVERAYFLLENDIEQSKLIKSEIADETVNPNQVELFDITTFDRNMKTPFIRVGTITKQADIQRVLKALANNNAKLVVVLTNKEVLSFEPSEELITKINNAFDR